jgi:hypothetical protein
MTPGRTFTIDTGHGAETATIAPDGVGTAAANPTTLMAAVSVGDTNIKVANIVGFAEGALVAIDTGNGTEVCTVARGGVGTAGRNLALAAPAAAGDTNIKVTSVFGFEVGMPVIVDASGGKPETRAGLSKYR